jgi:branched-chain amino acid transport system substrate-binding protein
MTRASLAIGATTIILSSVSAPVLAQEPMRIGVVLPLSGPHAQFGVNSRNGIELALEMLREQQGEEGWAAGVELVFADVPAPGAASSAVQRLVSRERVSGVLGSFVSSITLAASEVAERAEVPMITHSFADEITERGFDYIFQVSPQASTFGAAQFNYALELAEEAGDTVSSIAILYEDTSYGSAQAVGIRDAAAEAGVEIAIDEAYPLGLSDAAPLVNLVRRSNVDMVSPISYLNDSLLIIRTMRQQGVDLPTIGGAAGYIIPDFHRGLGEFSEGVFSISPANYDSIPDIDARYRELHGDFIAHESIMYGAALQHMVKAAEAAGTTEPRALRDAIAELEYCDGFAAGIPGGCTAFDDTGLTTTAFPIFVQWRGGELVTVHPAEAALAPAIWGSTTIDTAD